MQHEKNCQNIGDTHQGGTYTCDTELQLLRTTIIHYIIYTLMKIILILCTMTKRNDGELKI